MAQGALANVFRRLPMPVGKPIQLHFRPGLTAFRGRLLSRRQQGVAVHAGAFLRKRELILDSGLISRPSELARILIHEIFHFAWVRLGNARRRSFEELVRAELRRGARGELGWSAELRKNRLKPADVRDRSRRWREYLCESFCDTAAWRFAGLRHHTEFTLDAVNRARRRRWLRRAGLEACIPV